MVQIAEGLRPLVGSWRLLSRVNTFPDTDERIEAFGPDPDGRMVLDAGGRIVFLFMKANRKPPANDADRALLFNSMVAYTGFVTLDGPGRFITTIDVSWIPTREVEQLRFFTLDGDRLTIRTPAQIIPAYPDRQTIGELVWEREHPLRVG